MILDNCLIHIGLIELMQHVISVPSRRNSPSYPL